MIRRLGLVIVWCGLAACTTVVPSTKPHETHTPMSTSGPTVTAPPQATPNGTISIGCFLAVQSVVDDFRNIAFQLDAGFAIETQKNNLVNFVSHLQTTVVAAPTGCFSDQELGALEAFWAYVIGTPPRQLAKQRITELIAAAGLPYPTPAP